MKMNRRKAIRMVAYMNDYQGGDLNKWRNSFYEIWRHQMTWNFAYRIELQESRKNGVYVCLDVRLGYKQSALEMLEDLGYRKVNVFEETAGVFDDLDLDVDLVAAD